MKIDKKFFKKYEKPILWFINTWVGKKFFQVERMGHKLRKGEKIDRITPNSIRYKNKDNSYTEQFFSRNEYALKLAPLVWWLPIELITEGLNGGKALLRPAYQLALIALFLKAPKGLPLLGLTTTDFFPAAGENSPVDGYAMFDAGTSYLWTQMVNHEGVAANDTADDIYLTWWAETTTTDRWKNLRRGIVLFDTSVIDTDAISGATLSIYGRAKFDLTSNSPEIKVYSSNPANTNELIPADYSSLGDVAFSDGVTYADFNASGYNVWTLNGNPDPSRTLGLAAINKTGITKLGFRDSIYDAPNNPPSWVSDQFTGMTGNSADVGTNKPKLTVTYTPPVTAPTVTTQVVSDIDEETATGNGNITDDGGDAGATRGMCWDTSPNPTTANDKATNGTGEGAYTVAMTGLVAGTHYYVRAYSINSEGTSYGSQVEFDTIQNADVSVSEQALILTLPAPTINFDYELSVSEQELALTQPSPEIVIGRVFLATALQLSLEQHSPTLSYDYELSLSELALELALQTPSEAVDISVLLSELGLELEIYDPDTLIDTCVELSELGLKIEALEPLLMYWARQTKHSATWINSAKSSVPSWTNLKKR